MTGLELRRLPAEGPVPGPPALCVTGLTVRVGIRRVIESLSFELLAGERLYVTGPNGCGKSSLLNALAGIEPARIEAGDVELFGDSITRLEPDERARRGLVYLRQRRNVFPGLTVREHLQLALNESGRARFHDELGHWRLPLDSFAGNLSRGQQQRLAWATTVLRPARLLLLDEPEAGVADRLEPPPGITSVLVTHGRLSDGSRP